jgi:tetratricopeptide (TPR) repeat protein
MPSTPSHPFADHRRASTWVALGVALAALAPAPLRAQEQQSPAPVADGGDNIDPEARRLAERGLAHYEAGRYAEAIDDFQASYRITPAPGLLYDIAQAQRRKGDCAAALESYRRFLAENPTGNIRQLSESRIAETERCAAARVVDARPAPPPRADSQTAVSFPASGTPSLIKTSEPDRPPTRWRRRAGVGIGVAAVALGLASARYGWQAAQASDDVSAIYAREGTWGPYATAREQSGHDDERTALWLGAGALVSAAVSLWLLLRR